MKLGVSSSDHHISPMAPKLALDQIPITSYASTFLGVCGCGPWPSLRVILALRH